MPPRRPREAAIAARAVSALLLLLSLALGRAAGSGVVLKMEGRLPWMEMSCQVQNNRRTINLYCPHVVAKPPRPCFQQCTAVCTGPKCADIDEIGCKVSEETRDGRLLRNVTYTVNQARRSNAGLWWCQVGNQKSLMFNLAWKPPAKPPAKTTPPPTAKPKPTPKTKGTGTLGVDTGVTFVKPDPNPKKPDPDNGYTILRPKQPDPPRRREPEFWTELTSPQLVIVVLVLLGASLIVNVAFCIRCILVKKYIDKYRRGVSDTSCLERCLCLPKARLRGGYKEDLYEDLSSTPRVIYSPGGSAKSSGAEHDSAAAEFQSLARSRAYSPSSHRGQNPAARVGDIYATVVRGPRRSSGPPRYYSPQPPATQQAVYDSVPESRSLSDIYARPHKVRPSLGLAPAGHGTSSSSGSRRDSPDSTGTPSTVAAALHRVSERPAEEEEAAGRDPEQEGDLIEECTRNNTRLELSKTLLHRADTLLREAGVLLD